MPNERPIAQVAKLCDGVALLHSRHRDGYSFIAIMASWDCREIFSPLVRFVRPLAVRFPGYELAQ